MADNDQYHNMNLQSTLGQVDGEKKPDINDLQAQVKELRNQVEFLMQKRMTQVDFVPGCIRMTAMGEANRYIHVGLEANRPTEETKNGSNTAYFATDTNKLWIYNGTAWKSATFS